MKKIEFFKVEGDRINRIRKHCPKCGPAVFLAEHKDRFSCGKCGYTEFKGGIRPPKSPMVEEKPVEQPAETASEDLKGETHVEEPKAEASSEIKPETPAEEHSKQETPISEVDTYGQKPLEPTIVETPIKKKPVEKTHKEESSSDSEQTEEKSTDESSVEDKK